jgi:hypothetical protein
VHLKPVPSTGPPLRRLWHQEERILFRLPSELSALPKLGQARARISQKIVDSRFAKHSGLNSPTHLSSSTYRAGRM